MYIITQGFLSNLIILGGFSAFIKYISTTDKFDGKAYYSSDGFAWTQFDGDYDLFHKIYYSTNPQPIGIITPAGNYDTNAWDQGDSYGVLVNDAGQLILDTKFLTSIIIDDSASMNASYNDVDYQTALRNLYSTLVTRSYKTLNYVLTQFTAADIWTFGTKISEKTKTGFSTSFSTTDAYLAALKRKGTNSELYEALDIAMVGLSPQSIIDMLIKEGDTTGNVLRATVVRDYLFSINALRLNDLKLRYKTETYKQETLSPQPGFATGYTVYLTLNGTNRYVWSTANYPYAEVVKNGTILTNTTDYTISPSLGKLVLTVELTTHDILEVNIRQDWDGTAATIPTSTDPRLFMIERWANSYTPLILSVADGDNISTNTLSDLITNTNTLWNDLGVKALLFSGSSSNNQKNLLPLSIQSNGRYFQVNSASDWTDITTSLVHNGEYSLFKGVWRRTFKYDTPQYIKYVYNASIVSSGFIIDSSVVIQFRYSMDKTNYSDWITIPNFTNYYLNKEITNIEYYVVMTEGWTGSISLSPIVSELYHVVVIPAERYYFSNTFDTTGMLFEYILTSNILSPTTSKLTWAVCRGDSTEWEDYTPIINGRNGVLPNRENSIQFTNEVLYQNLPTTTSNQIEFTVLKDGIIYRWTNKAIIAVYVDGVAVGANSYTYNGSAGTITFTTNIFTSQTVTVSIRYPAERFFAAGESTSTNDYRTYYLANGRWPADSEIVVLSNGTTINRNNYYLNREDGTVTFYKEQDHLSLITVFVLPSGTFRIGLKVEDYDDAVANVYDFGIQYSELPNGNSYDLFKSTTPPEIKDNLVRINSIGKLPTLGPNIESRMYIDYTFYSSQGNEETGTQTKWYRIRSGNSLEITATNGLPEYQNRTVQRLADLNGANNYFLPGDQIYVEVIPSDGFMTGITYTSESIILRSNSKPYITDVQIKANNPINSNSVVNGSMLTAYYVFNNGTDLSTIKWYEWTNSTSNLIYTGSTLPTEYVLAGKVISFIVYPFNGNDYGSSVESSQLNIT
jgi:hypothetical protein